MNSANLPVVLEHTEALKYELERKIHGIGSLINASRVLDIWDNDDQPHVNYTDAERSRLWELITSFEDECRDNFLRITEEGMAGRYRYLLRQYFAFLETAPQQLNEATGMFWTHYGPLVPYAYEADWYEQHMDTYYGTLTGWAGFLIDEIIPDVRRTLDTYNGYLLDRSVATIIAPGDPLHALHALSPQQRPALNEPSAKLTWQCKPAVAGYIISELIRAGYISPPTTNGELSINKLAKICEQLFDFTGHNPGQSSWRNVVDPERNTLPDTKRARLNLPDADQL